jgi:HEAT repeat protein
MLDHAFEALTAYDWGVDPGVLKPIDEAVITTHGDTAAREALETRLADVLRSGASRAAKDYVCRKLMIIGTAVSVPALAELLPQRELSHMSRYALERIPHAEAAVALRDSLAKVVDSLKVGIVGSLAARRDEASVPALVSLLGHTDTAVARAAVHALGAIHTHEAGKALSTAHPKEPADRIATTDALLACADGLLADGRKMEALSMYKGFTGEQYPKHVQLAAKRGMLACAGRAE